MKISVILAHPYEKSFNHAISETVKEHLSERGHEVLFHDLYAEHFDPVITGYELVNDTPEDGLVKRHISEIMEAEGIVIVHPNWWGQPPAILKGWVDRVLRQGVAYQFDAEDSGGGIPAGLLKAKAALVFNTANTLEDREREVFGDPLETLWRNCIFGFCGVRNVYRKVFSVVADSTEAQRKAWLEEVGDIVDRYF
jgi:NAD(P)H dehydrogenase (quinone)